MQMEHVLLVNTSGRSLRKGVSVLKTRSWGSKPQTYLFNDSHMGELTPGACLVLQHSKEKYEGNLINILFGVLYFQE